jgi:hypothetical protein
MAGQKMENKVKMIINIKMMSKKYSSGPSRFPDPGAIQPPL